nr:hypothetical protein [Rhodoferax sp.]
MSNSAFSAKVFAIYLFFAGAVLAIAPNLLLSVLQMPQTSEVWIRVAGLIAFMIGVYAWVAATHDFKPFLIASVYTRVMVFVVFVVFAALGLGHPMIMLFGVADLLGGIWMHYALKADAQSAQPA